MRFSLVIGCLVLLSCHKADDSLMPVEPAAYSIGNENLDDRNLRLSYTSTSDSTDYYAEFSDTLNYAYSRGMIFTMLDKRTGLIISTLKVTRKKRFTESWDNVFEPGDYQAMRGQTTDSQTVVVHFQPGSSTVFVPILKPGNIVRITDYSPKYFLMTFNLESEIMNAPPVKTFMRGRFLIRKN
jgi:hypothetical protein